MLQGHSQDYLPMRRILLNKIVFLMVVILGSPSQRLCASYRYEIIKRFPTGLFTYIFAKIAYTQSIKCKKNRTKLQEIYYNSKNPAAEPHIILGSLTPATLEVQENRCRELDRIFMMSFSLAALCTSLTCDPMIIKPFQLIPSIILGAIMTAYILDDLKDIHNSYSLRHQYDIDRMINIVRLGLLSGVNAYACYLLRA